eukprot:7376846-Prymnesium_polylepis.1
MAVVIAVALAYTAATRATAVAIRAYECRQRRAGGVGLSAVVFHRDHLVLEEALGRRAADGR